MQIFKQVQILVFCLFFSSLAIAQPTANFTATPVSGCAPLLVQFSDASTGGVTSWQWDLGNGVNSVLQNPSTTYATPGTYTVTLTATNANGSNTKTMTGFITVLSSPIVAFTTPDTAGCPPLTVNFTNTTNPVTPGAATYNWSFGDGNVSTAQSPTHIYIASGIYSVTLTATNSGGCTQSFTKTNFIHVFAPPVADFNVPAVDVCLPPATANFTTTVNGTAPYTYNWDFGDLTTGTGNNPSHVYGATGSYIVTLIVTDANGCKDTVVKTAFINIGATQASFTPPVGACLGSPFTFANTSVGATTFSWDFGDGGTSTATNPTYTYTTAGTYTVTLIAQSANCADTTIQTITVNPKPTASFSFAPLQPCPAPATIQFTNLSTNGVTYDWDFGDGSTSTATNPTHTYTSNAPFTVTLIATNAFGCKDTLIISDSLKVNALTLNAGAMPQFGCVPLDVNFTSSRTTNFPSIATPYPYNVANWQWDFGDGTPVSTDSTPTHTYNAVGVYTATLTITTVNGCSTIDTVVITVGPHPTAMFTSSPDTICMHSPVTFTNQTVGGVTYIWDFGDGGASTATSPTYTYANSSGTYTVILHAYNMGCEDTFMKQNLITVHPPTSKFSIIFDCDTPLMVRFIDTASIGVTSRLWLFGDNTTSTDSLPIHTYATNGSYNVTLVTFNNIYGCSDTLTLPIQLFNPAPTFVTADTAICKHDSITFNLTYPGSALTYDWYVGNFALTDTTHDIGFTFHQSGIYTVRVVVTDLHLCKDTFTRNNYVLVAKPDAGFKAIPTLGCSPLLVQFTDTSTDVAGTNFVSHAWTFGNGNTTTVTTSGVSNLYNAPGVFDVSLIVTDNVGCIDTLTKQGYIEARKPDASFYANDTTACIGQGVVFTNSSTGVSVSAAWDFGDNTTSTNFTPVHAYTQTGNYTVTLIVTDITGCKDTLVRTNYINVSKPQASFAMSDTLAICPPLNVQFTNNSNGAATYIWDFGNGSTSSLQNPSAIYTTPGVYNISMISFNANGCSDTAYATAKVLGYAGGLTYTPLAGCSPLEVQFTANITNVPQLIWDFSDGVTQPVTGGNTITHIYATPGAYLPKLILSDGAGCLNSSAGIDTIKVDGIDAGFITTAPCINNQIIFTDTSFSYFSPITSWLWNFNNGQAISTLATPNFTFANTGIYPIKLIVTNANGCKDTLVRNVTIYPLPTVTAFGDTIICLGDGAQLNATGANSYTWSPTANLSCVNCANPIASPATATKFVVLGTDTHGCENKDSVQIDLQFITTSTVGNSGQICNDSSFQLSASGAQTYHWTPAASLNDPNIANPIATPNTTTTYTVLAYEGSCPPDSHKVTVGVLPLPTVNAGADQTLIAGNAVQLQGIGSNINTFLWTPSQTLSCATCSDPKASPQQTTTYILTGISKFGCKNYDSVTVFILCDKSQVFIPNMFSPNGDGQNEVFYPRGHGLQAIKTFRVFNRWGEIVFERNNIQLNDETNGWDGKVKGKEVSTDVFVYYIDGVCDNGSPLIWKGDVTLMR